jgi:hypothetical protein
VKRLRLVIAAILALALAGCGGDDDDGGTTTGGSPCPDLDGATRAEVEEAFGRPADSVEDYGGGQSSHYWYFGDDDQVVITFGAGGVDGYAWHDGDEFMMAADEPGCPLPPPDEDHPAAASDTTALEDRGIEDIVENPEGVQERTEERYAEFVECRLADEVSDEECPTPGEQLDEEG